MWSSSPPTSKMATLKRATPPLGSAVYPLKRNSIDESATLEEENFKPVGPAHFPRGTPLDRRYCSKCGEANENGDIEGLGLVRCSICNKMFDWDRARRSTASWTKDTYPPWNIRRESKGNGAVESSQQQQGEGSTSESSTIRADDRSPIVDRATSTEKRPCQHVDEKHPSLLDETSECMHTGDSCTLHCPPVATPRTIHAQLAGPEDPAKRRKQILDRFFT